MKVATQVLDELPPGVTIVKRYRAGYTLLLCAHDESEQRPTGCWVAWRDEDTYDFEGDGPASEARSRMPVGSVLDYKGVLRCRFCGGDEFTTDSFSRPVKKIVHLAKGVVPVARQEMLF